MIIIVLRQDLPLGGPKQTKPMFLPGGAVTGDAVTGGSGCAVTGAAVTGGLLIKGGIGALKNGVAVTGAVGYNIRVSSAFFLTNKH